jgi:hypothetical protein
MAEKLKIKAEQHEILEAPKTPERLPDAEHAEPLRSGEKDPTEALKEARETISEIDQPENNPLESLKKEQQPDKPLGSQTINSELKKITLNRELNNIRRKLPTSQRILSKFAHQPAVSAVSEVTGKTLSRPSGLLGGGILAFVGSSSYLYLAKHLGFDYNYFVFFALFIAGFLVGVSIELLVSLVFKKKQQ